MSTTLSTMIRLRGIQNKMRQLVEDLDDNIYRTQYHPELSPIGWHLGHSMYIENFWLHEFIQSNNKYTRKQKKIYIPENCPVSKRGKKLPKLKDILKDIQQQQDDNDLLLIEMVPPLSDHTLFKDEFIQNHIIQHYARHYEIMQIILHQMALHNNHPDFLPETVLTAETISRQVEQIPQGKYKIGGDPAFAYDNERPEHVVELDTYNISMHPVSNAEYLAFIEDRGYQTSEYWSADGWQWLSENNIHHPEHWRQNRNGDWYGINQQGPFTLANNDCVYGINFYEASAFAHWANARLPHEYEWETCAKLERIQNSGKVWEWCSNLFQAYDQFQAFPDNTTEASFDDKHYVLKGASQYTRPEIRRASYRNYQTPEKRYIFAGLRLVFD